MATTKARKEPDANGTAVPKPATAPALPGYAAAIVRKAIADHAAAHETYKRLWTAPIHEDNRWINVAAGPFGRARAWLIEVILATGPKAPANPNDEWRGLAAHQRGPGPLDPRGVIVDGMLYLVAYSDESTEYELAIVPMADVIDLDDIDA